MRMEELNNGNFIKSTDSVERYLLDLIKDYFNASGIADDNSREYIIQKAVTRMKEELFIDNAGVVSFNGQTGVVTLTLEDLGGEPAISPKKSAFNVNFGNINGTACEGNDERLSNKRDPIDHIHSIDDVNGLAGELSTILNNINLLSNKTHKHDNKKILDKLVYTGSNDIIDLTIIETADTLIKDKTQQVNNTINEVTIDFESLKTQILNQLNQYTNDYSNTINSIETKGEAVRISTQEYTNTLVEDKMNEINTSLNNKITKTQLNSLITIVNKGFVSIYENTFNNIIPDLNQITNLDISLPVDITTTLNLMNPQNYKIDFKIIYIDPLLGKEVETVIPFIYASNGQLKYSVTASIKNNDTIQITSNRFVESWESFITNASVVCRISILNNVPEVV